MNGTAHLPPRIGHRVAECDWSTITDELDEYGNAPTGQLLTPAECREIANLYDEPDHFRSTVDMARHRFGSGQYRYFTHELPDTVAELRAAFYPRLLPVARDWVGGVEADDDLEREEHLAEQVAVQGVPVAGTVTQQDPRRGPVLTSSQRRPCRPSRGPSRRTPWPVGSPRTGRHGRRRDGSSRCR